MYVLYVDANVHVYVYVTVYIIYIYAYSFTSWLINDTDYRSASARLNPKTILCYNIGNNSHSYLKWPSQNSWFTHEKNGVA